MKRRLVCSLVTSMVTAASLLCAGLAQGSERPKQTTVRVIHEIKHDVSASLGELASMTPAQPLPFSPRMLKILPTGPAADVPEIPMADQALQKVELPPVAAVVGLNFDGLGLGQY